MLASMETDPRETPSSDERDDSQDTPPPLPADDDDSALGDTDQHSDADA
jgi:hypothetical protein